MKIKTPPKKAVKAAKPTKLSKTTLEKMLEATYEKGFNGEVNGYAMDKKLSSGRVRVFHDDKTKHTVVAHRGSQNGRDWFENGLYALNLEVGKGWNRSKTAQKNAEKKYGTGNLTTIGHSKGALHAEKFGKKGGETITLNKPVNLPHALFNPVADNQTDYTGEGDVVSILRPLQRGNKQVVLKKKKSLYSRAKGLIKKGVVGYILDEHSTKTLNRLPSEDEELM